MPGGQVLLGMSFLRDMELLQRDDQLGISALVLPLSRRDSKQNMTTGATND